ncbi:MAG TPA: polysaccharide deacetylase family protein [Bacteroidia bacterium]|jgi:peptidoglycan/xylan/chitin deacetylase (PgdA/CDA1 family)|nr:polysaccharide deacetylase family protein [Bacteroidia bacterium]
MNIKVFLFHRINPYKDAVWPPVTPAHFDKILTYLKKSHEIVPLEKTILGQYKPRSKNLCAITFDDGYKDFIEYAMPILAKHRSTASMYVITDCVNSNLPPWTFLFNYLLINTKSRSLIIDSEDIPVSFRKIVWNGEAQKLAFIKSLSPLLKKISDKSKENIITQIESQIKDVEEPRGLMLNWSDIRNMKREGIEIGSHSANHPVLSKEPSTDTLHQELIKSGQEIERETGQFPLAISYPFGAYDTMVKEIARKAGYKMGLTVFPKVFSLADDKFEIPRIELYNEPFYKSRIRMNANLVGLKNFFMPDRFPKH